jgi:hypothetical protein
MTGKRSTWKTIGIVLCTALIGASGCTLSSMHQTAPENSCEEDKYIVRLKQSEQLREQLHRQLTDCQAEAESLRTENRSARIELLEKGALIRQLDAQLSYRQQLIDEAVLEVVRAKAKLRSIESRAEAASAMAETEIALKGLKEKDFQGSNGASDQYDKVESMLKMSADEFKRENYGGALYLAGQAKVQIKAIQSSRSHEAGDELTAGEVLFRPSLPLIVLKRSNLRKFPDLDSEVLRVLEKGMPITGYSHKDVWVRVRFEDGESGWIHQSLIKTTSP